MNIDEKLEESIENKYMKNDKGKNKMELTIEESVYILKRKDFNMYVENRAIETLLTAYEKEKEAINNLRLNVTNVGISVYDGTTSLFKMRDIQIVLNLIEKQSKEIEELKNADLTTVYLNGFYDGEKKVKDKIKAKIEEVKDGTFDAKIVLQSLLEKE